MAVIAGIDEAGYGPILGPMVVGAVALELPDQLLDADLWQVLSASVSRRARRNDPRLACADSKKLFARQRGVSGLRHLERAVLAAVTAADRSPASLRELLQMLAPATLPVLSAYPWYDNADLALPHSFAADELSACSTLLGHDLAQQGLCLHQVRAEVIPAGELNRLFAQTGNKSQALFEITARHLLRLHEHAGPDQRLLVHLDRQGARKRYRGLLQETFSTTTSDAWVWIHEETDESSAYTIETDRGTVELRFAVGCEEQQLPVALASMISKYLRELLMELLNRFWREQVPGLRPTAGYAVDGRRFLAEIEPVLQSLDIDRDLLLRRR
jgi:ribonuclease HII